MWCNQNDFYFAGNVDACCTAQSISLSLYLILYSCYKNKHNAICKQDGNGGKSGNVWISAVDVRSYNNWLSIAHDSHVYRVDSLLHLPACCHMHACVFANDSNWKWSQYLPVIANSVQLCCLHFEEKVHCWELLLSRVHSRHCLTYFNVKVSRSVLNKGDIWNWLWRVKTMSCIGEYDQKLCNLYLSR